MHALLTDLATSTVYNEAINLLSPSFSTSAFATAATSSPSRCLVISSGARVSSRLFSSVVTGRARASGVPGLDEDESANDELERQGAEEEEIILPVDAFQGDRVGVQAEVQRAVQRVPHDGVGLGAYVVWQDLGCVAGDQAGLEVVE